MSTSPRYLVIQGYIIITIYTRISQGYIYTRHLKKYFEKKYFEIF